MESAPSLDRTGRIYVATVVGLGFLVIGDSLVQLHQAPLGSQGLQWLLLAVLTLISGSASVELPRANVSISISEAFVFTAVLLYGPAAGTLTVALDGLVISFWVARRRPELHRALFNIAAPALSAWCSSELFFWVSGIAPLADQPATLIEFLPSLVLFALVYFGLNSWLIAFVIAIQRKLNPFDVWRGGFLWLSLNYFCGASLAILLVGYNRTIDLRFVGVVVPLLLVLYFTFKTSMQRVEDANKHVDELNTLYLSTIETLAMAIDAKDQVTHGHIRRVQSYAASLAKAVGVRELKLLKAIEAAALLHDMGKLAVPEYILNKPGKLTETEFDKMKLHASIGADILSAIDFPYPVVPIVRHHHENWDGTGYPAGLKGTDIPIGARILSVVDCFDALTSDRPYRPRLGDDEAIRILLDRRGSMYDPLVVDTFIEVHRAIEPTDLKSGPPQRILNEIASARKLAAPHSETLDEIAASSDEMLTLYELAGALAGQINLADAGDLAAKHLKRLVPSALCVIYIYDRNTSEVEARHAVGDGSATVRGLRITVGHRLTGWVAANRQTIVNSDPVLDFGDLARSHALSLKSCLSTPLIRNESVLGVLSLYSTESNAFNEDHRRIIEAVARQMAHTIETTLERDAASKRDDSGSLAPLSDLEAMALTRASSCEAQDAHALLLVRTANLHHIIAVHGSNVGQEVVQSVVRHLRTVLRGNDRLFKDAAGEIVVLLPNTDLSTAQELADHIQTGLLKRPVTVSVGTVVVEVTTTVAGYPLKGETIADTLKNVAQPGNGDIVKRVVH